MADYISELISAIVGFFVGGSTVWIIMHIKHNRISSKQQGDNIASSGGVAAGNVQGNIVITNNAQPVDTTPVLSSEAKRILKELHPDTKICFTPGAYEMFAFSDTRQKRQMSCKNNSCTEEALNELETLQYLESKATYHFTIYHLTAKGRVATSKIVKQQDIIDE